MKIVDSFYAVNGIFSLQMKQRNFCYTRNYLNTLKYSSQTSYESNCFYNFMYMCIYVCVCLYMYIYTAASYWIDFTVRQLCIVHVYPQTPASDSLYYWKSLCDWIDKSQLPCTQQQDTNFTIT